MKIQKQKLHHLLLKSNHNENRNSCVLFVAMIIKPETCPHRDEVAKIFKGNSQPVVLTQPFPQQQSMVAQTLAPPAGGNHSHPPSEEAPSSVHIYMFNGIDLTTRTTTYDTPTKPNKEKVTNSTPLDPSPATVSPPSRSLQIEKPTFNFILFPLKSTIHKSTFNASSCAAQNYNIVEDLA